jgi:hypothetical protein
MRSPAKALQLCSIDLAHVKFIVILAVLPWLNTGTPLPLPQPEPPLPIPHISLNAPHSAAKQDGIFGKDSVCLCLIMIEQWCLVSFS